MSNSRRKEFPRGPAEVSISEFPSHRLRLVCGEAAGGIRMAGQCEEADYHGGSFSRRRPKPGPQQRELLSLLAKPWRQADFWEPEPCRIRRLGIGSRAIRAVRQRRTTRCA